MNHAIALGHVETNPTRDVKPNPRAALTRFLSLEEIACLHRVLDGYAPSRASRRRQADIIRLLLLTGCRKGEIVTLRWREVEGDTLNLADSKTGPRKVFLNTPARAVIERQPRTDSPFVFPSPRDPERACSPNLPLWYSVRRQAGIEDVRLHDLRHTFASHAQVAIPLGTLTAGRVESLYDLMDAAYDSIEIWAHCILLGHKPIIDVNPRRSVEMQEALKQEKKARRALGLFFPEERRYVVRSGSERINGRLKDEFGGRHVRVRGYDKVLAHLMFGMTVLTASQLMRLIVPPI